MSSTSDTAIWRDDEQPAKPAPLGPSRWPPVLSSELTSARRAYSAGASPADHACSDRHHQGHAEHAPVEAEIDPQRHLERQTRDAVLHGCRRAHRQQNGACAAEDREHDALREELPNDPSASGPRAPRAAPISRPRDAARASSMFAMLALVMAQEQSGQQREHGRGDVEHRAVLRHRPRLGSPAPPAARRPCSSSGYWAASTSALTASAARACSSRTPGLRRATTLSS